MNRIRVAVLLLFLSAGTADAQVLISEVQPNPLGTTSDGAEWIELHNTAAAAANIGAWRIVEYAGGATYQFAAGTMLAANQVVIVTLNAADFTTMAIADSFPVTAANFELATTTDDPGVPNLTQTVAGAFALANTGGGVILLDNSGAMISFAEWGTGRAEVPGNPAAAPGDGESIGRINTTGSSDVDFAVLAAPTPGTGYGGVAPTPPIISNPARAPASIAFGSTFTVSATISDADGIGSASVYFATATASIGSAAGPYAATAMTDAGANNRRASGVIDSLVAFPAPTTFSERYVRYFISATDALANSAALPAGAITTAENTAYYWENVLPQSAVFSIAEVREQTASELPIWDGHAVRIEGVALTDTESFIAGSTNFFIASRTGVDAIRVFDDARIAQNVSPGDLVRVTGKIAAFRGVRQIGRDERMGQPAVRGVELEVVLIGTAPVPMQNLDIATLLANGEQNESQLIEISGVMLVQSPNGDPIPPTWAGNSTLYVSDGTGTLAVRIAPVIDLADTPTPSGMFDLRGIFTQFAPGGTGGYQIQPRSIADVIGGGPPIDAGVPDGGGDMDGGADDRGMDAMAADSGIDSGADGGSGADASPADARDAGFFGTDRGSRGCGCAAAQEERSGGWSLLLAALAAWALRPGRGRSTRFHP